MIRPLPNRYESQADLKHITPYQTTLVGVYDENEGQAGRAIECPDSRTVSVCM